MYLLDTNIVIFLFKKKYNVADKIKKIGMERCLISEVTVAELKYGAEKSTDPDRHRKIVNEFINDVQIIPIFDAIDIFAKEKVRLENKGTPMHDNFDVLIAATALTHDLILVTNNTKHFIQFEGLKLEDWVQ